MPISPYQMPSYQDQGPSTAGRKYLIVVIIFFIIVVIVALLFILGRGGRDINPQPGQVLSPQEKLEILEALSDDSVERPSVDERRAILEEMSKNNPDNGINEVNGNNNSASPAVSRGLSEEEKLNILQSLKYQ